MTLNRIYVVLDYYIDCTSIYWYSLSKERACVFAEIVYRNGLRVSSFYPG